MVFGISATPQTDVHMDLSWLSRNSLLERSDWERTVSGGLWLTGTRHL